MLGERIDSAVLLILLIGCATLVIWINALSQDQIYDRLQTSLQETTNLRAALDEHAIVAITNPAGRITSVNDKFCSISQYSRSELIGQDHRIINSGYHPAAFFRDLWTTIGKGRVWKGEIRNRAKDGSFYWMETTIVPFMDTSGRIFQHVAIRADITSRKAAQEKVNLLNVDLERRVASRTRELETINKELDAFSYSVSHDLRAPLRAISGFSRILSESFTEKLDEETSNYFDRIVAAAERMSSLIDDLLALSRISRDPLDIAPTNLSEIARDSRLRSPLDRIRTEPSRWRSRTILKSKGIPACSVS